MLQLVHVVDALNLVLELPDLVARLQLLDERRLQVLDKDAVLCVTNVFDADGTLLDRLVNSHSGHCGPLHYSLLSDGQELGSSRA